MRKLSSRFLICLSLFILLSSRITFGQLIYIPSSDPINGHIAELQARGYLRQLSQSERPWLQSDVARAILADKLSFVGYDKKIAEAILACLKPSQMVRPELLSSSLGFGLGVRGLYQKNRDGYFPLRTLFINRDNTHEIGSTYKGGFWLSSESKWGMDTELLFDSKGTRYPWYYGTPHTGSIVGQFDRAYFTVQTGRFDFLFGRQRLIWGPSPRGSLLLNDTSPPLDMIEYVFTLRPFRFSGFASRLDDYIEPSPDTVDWRQVKRRYLSGHRIDLTPGKGLEFGLSEIYLYGGANRLPEIYYNLPLILYYWEAQNRNLDDNAFWALDVSWIKKKLGRFYAQWVFDDIQRQHRGPQKWAIQAGMYLVPEKFRNWSGIFEFNYVETYVFGQRQRVNAYLNWGWPIGRLDSDQREYFAGIYKRLNEAIKIGAEFTGRDKGQYNAADIQPNMAPFGTPFPSGIVEKIKSLALTSSIHEFNRLDGELSIGYEAIHNFNHESGHTSNQPYITMQISCGIKTGLPFWKKFL
jgi:hypothetical protein